MDSLSSKFVGMKRNKPSTRIPDPPLKDGERKPLAAVGGSRSSSNLLAKEKELPSLSSNKPASNLPLSVQLPTKESGTGKTGMHKQPSSYPLQPTPAATEGNNTTPTSASSSPPNKNNNNDNDNNNNKPSNPSSGSSKMLISAGAPPNRPPPAVPETQPALVFSPARETAADTATHPLSSFTSPTPSPDLHGLARSRSRTNSTRRTPRARKTPGSTGSRRHEGKHLRPGVDGQQKLFQTPTRPRSAQKLPRSTSSASDMSRYRLKEEIERLHHEIRRLKQYNGSGRSASVTATPPARVKSTVSKSPGNAPLLDDSKAEESSDLQEQLREKKKEAFKLRKLHAQLQKEVSKSQTETEVLRKELQASKAKESELEVRMKAIEQAKVLLELKLMEEVNARAQNALSLDESVIWPADMSVQAERLNNSGLLNGGSTDDLGASGDHKSQHEASVSLLDLSPQKVAGGVDTRNFSPSSREHKVSATDMETPRASNDGSKREVSPLTGDSNNSLSTAPAGTNGSNANAANRAGGSSERERHLSGMLRNIKRSARPSVSSATGSGMLDGWGDQMGPDGPPCCIAGCHATAAARPDCEKKLCLKHVFRSVLPDENRAVKVAKELIASERSYLKGQDTLCHLFYRHLEVWSDMGQPILERNQMAVLFGNIREVARLSQDLMNDLDAAAGLEGLGSAVLCQNVALILLHYLPRFEIYREYMIGYGKAQYLLARLTQQDTMKDFLELCERIAGRQVSSFMIEPVQRLPRYLLLLKQMKKELLSEEEAGTHIQPQVFEDIESCFRQFTTLTADINNTLNEMKAADSTQELEETFEEDALCQALLMKHRELIKQGVVKKKVGKVSRQWAHSTSTVTLYLFKDCIAYAIRVVAKRKLKIKFLAEITSLTYKIVKDPKSDIVDIHLFFGGRSIVIQISSAQELTQWVKAFEQFSDPSNLQKGQKAKRRPSKGSHRRQVSVTTSGNAARKSYHNSPSEKMERSAASQPNATKLKINNDVENEGSEEVDKGKGEEEAGEKASGAGQKLKQTFEEGAVGPDRTLMAERPILPAKKPGGRAGATAAHNLLEKSGSFAHREPNSSPNNLNASISLSSSVSSSKPADSSLSFSSSPNNLNANTPSLGGSLSGEPVQPPPLPASLPSGHSSRHSSPARDSAPGARITPHLTKDQNSPQRGKALSESGESRPTSSITELPVVLHEDFSPGSFKRPDSDEAEESAVSATLADKPNSPEAQRASSNTSENAEQEGTVPAQLQLHEAGDTDKENQKPAGQQDKEHSSPEKRVQTQKEAPAAEANPQDASISSSSTGEPVEKTTKAGNVFSPVADLASPQSKMPSPSPEAKSSQQTKISLSIVSHEDMTSPQSKVMSPMLSPMSSTQQPDFGSPPINPMMVGRPPRKKSMLHVPGAKSGKKVRGHNRDPSLAFLPSHHQLLGSPSKLMAVDPEKLREKLGSVDPKSPRHADNASNLKSGESDDEAPPPPIPGVEAA